MELKPFTLEDVQDAYGRIAPFIAPTPLEQSITLSNNNREVYLKLECNQPQAHSFKIRGALNKIASLTQIEREQGVAAISSGNHGIAVCCASKWLDLPAPEIIIPRTTPQTKIDTIKFYGGKVVLLGDNYDEAHTQGEEYLKRQSKTVVDAYFEDVRIFAGQGTVALELLKQNPNIDTIVVPIGGGGLVGGIAVAAKGINPNIRVIGVQTDACPAMVDSIADGVCYTERDSKESRCAALVGGVGIRGYEICKTMVDDIILVTEDEILDSLHYAMMTERQIIEPSSAVVLAAERFHRDAVGGRCVALVVSGGNVDSDMILEVANIPN